MSIVLKDALLGRRQDLEEMKNAVSILSPSELMPAPSLPFLSLQTTQTDNNMINGTKLLNVATQVTRGKRDTILKMEKSRVVVKSGSMHLKGVWSVFDNAFHLIHRFCLTYTSTSAIFSGLPLRKRNS